MTAKVETLGGCKILRVSGRIDFESALDFEHHINAMIHEGGDRYIIELSQVELLSSAGLRVMLSTAKRNASLALAAPSQVVRQVFEISHFNLLFKIFPTVQAAIAALKDSTVVADPEEPGQGGFPTPGLSARENTRSTDLLIPSAKPTEEPPIRQKFEAARPNRCHQFCSLLVIPLRYKLLLSRLLLWRPGKRRTPRQCQVGREGRHRDKFRRRYRRLYPPEIDWPILRQFRQELPLRGPRPRSRGTWQNIPPCWRCVRREPVILAKMATSLGRRAVWRCHILARSRTSRHGTCSSANSRGVGLFSHRKTCSTHLSWTGLCCAPVSGKTWSMLSTRRSSAGTCSDSDSFRNSERRDSFREFLVVSDRFTVRRPKSLPLDFDRNVYHPRERCCPFRCCEPHSRDRFYP